MGLMATVWTQHATPMGQIRCLFVGVIVVGKVIYVIYQVGFNIDFIFFKIDIIKSLYQNVIYRGAMT